MDEVIILSDDDVSDPAISDPATVEPEPIHSSSVLILDNEFVDKKIATAKVRSAFDSDDECEVGFNPKRAKVTSAAIGNLLAQLSDDTWGVASVSDPISSSPTRPAKQPTSVPSPPPPLPPSILPPPLPSIGAAPLIPSHYGQVDIVKFPSPQQLQEANKVTRTKNDIIKEMTLFMPHSVYNMFDKMHLSETFPGDGMQTYANTLPLIYWRRTTTALWDDHAKLFLPCQPFSFAEQTGCLYYPAAKFVDLLEQDELSGYIAHSRSELKGGDIILLVEGLDQLFRKLKSAHTAYHRAQLLERMGEASARPSGTRPTRSVEEIQKHINQLQYNTQVNVFTVNGNLEMCQWLLSFTHSVGARHYMQNQDPLGGVHIRSGADIESTFVQAMSQFRLLTAKRAQSLYSAFPSLPQVYSQLVSHGEIGPDSNGKNIVPPSVERMILRAFTSNDPDTLIND